MKPTMIISLLTVLSSMASGEQYCLYESLFINLTADIIPFTRPYPIDIMHHIAYLSCVTGLDAKQLALVNKRFLPVSRRFLFRRVSMRKGRTVGFNLDLYMKHSHLRVLARSFELESVAIHDIPLLHDLLHLFDTNFNLNTFIVTDVNFHTPLCLSLSSMARPFRHLVLKGCKFDGIHVTALLNGMPLLKTVDIGKAATAYSYMPYVADAADIARLAEVPADLSTITSFAYNCDMPFSFQTSQAGNTVHCYRPLLNDMFFECAILPRVATLQHAKLFIRSTSHKPSLQLLATLGAHLESLALVFAYGEPGYIKLLLPVINEVP